MNCQDLRQKLSYYLHGELTPQESSSLEEHVASCSSCANHRNKREELEKFIRKSDIVNVSFDKFTSKVLDRLPKHPDQIDAQKHVAQKKGLSLFYYGSMAAAGIILALVLWQIFPSQHDIQVISGEVSVSDGRITTGADQYAVVKLSDNTIVELGPQTELVVKKEKTSTQQFVQLNKGAATFKTEKDNEPFMVKTAMAKVSGRKFRVDMEQKEGEEMKRMMTVMALAGFAQVTNAQGEIQVDALQKAYVQYAKAPSKQSPQEKQNMEALLKELAKKPTTEWLDFTSAQLKTKPELLGLEGKISLAAEFLREETIQKNLKKIVSGEQELQMVKVDHAWFYIGALAHADGELRQCAAFALSHVASDLKGKEAEEAVHAVLDVLQDAEVGVRWYAAMTLAKLASLNTLSKELVEKARQKAEAALKKEADKTAKHWLEQAVLALTGRSSVGDINPPKDPLKPPKDSYETLGRFTCIKHKTKDCNQCFKEEEVESPVSYEKCVAHDKKKYECSECQESVKKERLSKDRCLGHNKWRCEECFVIEKKDKMVFVTGCKAHSKKECDQCFGKVTSHVQQCKKHGTPACKECYKRVEEKQKNKVFKCIEHDKVKCTKCGSWPQLLPKDPKWPDNRWPDYKRSDWKDYRRKDYDKAEPGDLKQDLLDELRRTLNNYAPNRLQKENREE